MSSSISPTQPVDYKDAHQGTGSDLGFISLVIARRHVGVYPVAPSSIDSARDVTTATTIQPPLPPSRSSPALEYVTLLSGSLHEFHSLAGEEHSGWLIDIAHDMCDPQHKRGNLCILVPNEPNPVLPTAPLVPAVYVYSLAAGIVVGLAKISNRLPRSRSSGSGRAGDMRLSITLRDRSVCWITRFECRGNEVDISHIIPKRLGDWQASHILSVFTGLPGVQRTIYDPLFGICLQPNHARKFEDFEIGLRHVADEIYAVHMFTRADVWTAAGPGGPGPLLHGLHITPPTPGHTDNPPPGLFRWHYLQCVIKMFGHADYAANLPNMLYTERPMRMEGDSDDEGTDDEATWPSHIWDRGRLAYDMQEQEKHRIAGWFVSSQNRRACLGYNVAPTKANVYFS